MKQTSVTKFLLALPRGYSNRITFAELSLKAGVYEPPATVNTGRNSRKFAQLLTRLGVPIVADNTGVWMAITPRDIRRYVANLENRREALLNRIIDIGRIMKKMEKDGFDAVMDEALGKFYSREEA